MRKTKLKRVSAGVSFTVLAVAVLLALLRALWPGVAESPEGAALFAEKGCAQCHHTESTKPKIGPGLKGLFSRETLPVSKRAVSEENIRKQILTPYEAMPSYSDRLTEEQIDTLVAYLKTL